MKSNLRRSAATLAVVLCLSSCSAEKAQQEATGLGLALGLAILSPLIVLTIPYSIVESAVASDDREELAKKLDPVYGQFTASIRSRDARADAQTAFSESGAVFLIVGRQKVGQGMRYVRVPGVLNPDGFVCSRIAPYGESTTLAGSLRNLVSNDPLAEDAGTTVEATRLQSWKDYDMYRDYYAASFNRHMVEFAAPPGIVARPDGNESPMPNARLCNLETGEPQPWPGAGT
jgi:hypothetical protein